jgi:ubiquinone/menaquinone biosynthesis C-methylase UbiE
MPILSHFDMFAPFYEMAIRPPDPAELIRRLGLPAAGALLDAGGGTGRTAQLLRGKAGPIVVADLSHGMLAQVRKKEGLHAVHCRSERLPFPDDCFARILMADTFHHVDNQRAVAEELYRVLRSGGRLVIEEPDIRTLPVKLIAAGERLAFMHSRFLPPDRIADLFRSSTDCVSVESRYNIAWVAVEKRRTD